MNHALAIKFIGMATLATLTLGCAKADKKAASPDQADLHLTPVVYAEDAHVPDKVKSECGLDQSIPEYIAGYAPMSSFVDFEGRGPGAQAATLSIRLIGMAGTGGGAYTGPKFIELEGELTKGGEVIGSFSARRTSTGGMWGGYKGTCGILARCAKALGKDIGEWLENPKPNSTLGEF